MSHYACEGLRLTFRRGLKKGFLNNTAGGGGDNGQLQYSGVGQPAKQTELSTWEEGEKRGEWLHKEQGNGREGDGKQTSNRV